MGGFSERASRNADTDKQENGWTPYNLIFKRLRRENFIYFFLMLLILLYQPLSKYYREVMEVHQKESAIW